MLNLKDRGESKSLTQALISWIFLKTFKRVNCSHASNAENTYQAFLKRVRHDSGQFQPKTSALVTAENL